MKKRVLIIDDDESVLSSLSRFLEVHGVTTSVAADEKSAIETFDQESHELDLVCLDGCLGGYKFNTQPILRHLLDAGFKKPIVSISGNPDIRQIMVKEGCTHHSDKMSIGERVLSLLNISQD